MTEEDINVVVRGQRRGHMKEVGHQLTRVSGLSSAAAGSLTNMLASTILSRMPSMSSAITRLQGCSNRTTSTSSHMSRLCIQAFSCLLCPQRRHLCHLSRGNLMMSTPMMCNPKKGYPRGVVNWVLKIFVQKCKL